MAADAAELAKRADTQKVSGRAPAPAERDVVLRVLYGLSSSLAAFQIFWFFKDMGLAGRLGVNMIPKAELAAVEKRMAQNMRKMIGPNIMSEGGSVFFARAFTMKYVGHSFVSITHIFAAPLWAAIIPFQLHPASRSPALKKWHRAFGSTFFALSASLMGGLAAIFGRRLQMHPRAEWAKGAEGKTLGKLPALLRVMIPAADPFLVLSALWFTYTMFRSLKAAWRKRFAEHEDWVMRHVASGQWVALMRILLAPFYMFSMPRYGDTEAVQISNFASAAHVGWIICFAGAEVAVARVRANRAAAKAASAARRGKAAQVEIGGA